MSSKALTARFGGNGGAFFDHVAHLLESDTHERLLMEYTGRMTAAVVSQRNTGAPEVETPHIDTIMVRLLSDLYTMSGGRWGYFQQHIATFCRHKQVGKEAMRLIAMSGITGTSGGAYKRDVANRKTYADTVVEMMRQHGQRSGRGEADGWRWVKKVMVRNLKMEVTCEDERTAPPLLPTPHPIPLVS